MALFDDKMNDVNRDDGIINQDDLFIDSDPSTSMESPDFNLRSSEYEEEENIVLTNTTNTSNSVDADEFVNIFAQNKQEEIVLSDEAIKNITEDIILEKPKAKFQYGYLIWGALFVIVIFLSIGAAYLISEYSIVSKYNVAEADYFFDEPFRFSIVEQGVYCDTRYLREGMDVLYSESGASSFTHFKKFRIDSINQTNVFGYDYETQEYFNIPKEYIYYIIDVSSEPEETAESQVQETVNTIESNVT